MLNNSDKFIKMLHTEVSAMAKINYPYVLKMIDYGCGTVTDVITGDVIETCCFMALELAQEKSLFDFIKQVDGLALSEELAVVLFEQFIKGLQAIHLGGFCHRDIKCDNILLDKEFNIKIADFGMAGDVSKKLTAFLGTPGLYAPEILRLRLNQSYSGQ